MLVTTETANEPKSIQFQELKNYTACPRERSKTAADLGMAKCRKASKLESVQKFENQDGKRKSTRGQHYSKFYGVRVRVNLPTACCTGSGIWMGTMETKTKKHFHKDFEKCLWNDFIISNFLEANLIFGRPWTKPTEHRQTALTTYFNWWKILQFILFAFFWKKNYSRKGFQSGGWELAVDVGSMQQPRTDQRAMFSSKIY